MQEELEKGETFTVPEVNVLHETAEPARTYSTFVQKRVAGEPVAGPLTNVTADAFKGKLIVHFAFLSESGELFSSDYKRYWHQSES